jgi:peptidoglycan/xylan/chitin deacetylase (PgdA/CDA1 family)
MRPSEPGRVVVFWDYDTQWGADADRERRAQAASGRGHLEFAATDRLLELHDQYGIPACFAVVGAAALPGARPYHDPVQIRRIHAGGHEIASHSFRHEWLPGLGRAALHETLARSKDALEQCIGDAVVSFVPPYNQPFDYAAGWSFSLSERRGARPARTDLRGLCDALRDAGYRFCRVAYRPMHLRIADRLVRRPLDGPARVETIAGVTCVRLNTFGGFDEGALTMVRRCAKAGGIAVVYGHPHSLDARNSQDETWLRPFLEELSLLRAQHRLLPCLPRQLVSRES